MLLEIRRYTALPGQRDAWVSYMEDVIIPFQVSKGMTILGSFVDVEDENVYVWLRRFDNETQRKLLYTAVYESPEWINNIAPQTPRMLDREKTIITRVTPTPGSLIQ